MRPLVNTTKKATNIAPSSDVLTEVKALGINISQPCDQPLSERRGQQDNADFIAAYNQTVTAEGLPLGSWQMF